MPGKLVSALLVAAALSPAANASPPVADLESRMRAIVSRSRGSVGATVVHVESGERASIRGGERAPMFSVYKLPIALHVLALVDEGRLTLGQAVTLEPKDMRTGQSPLAVRARGSRLTLPLREVVEAAISVSDNTACDALLRLGGGPEAVSARLRGLGLTAVRVDRPEVQIAADLAGVELPPPGEWTLGRLQALFRGPGLAQRRAAMDRFLADPRDTATPDGMVGLLVRVHRRDLLKPETAALLQGALEETSTGPRRLPGKLPRGTVVAHKTGTGPSVGGVTTSTNDVGLVALPGGSGHLALAVFVVRSDASEPARDAVIADLARAAYDHWSR